jgi:transposase-like protein
MYSYEDRIRAVQLYIKLGKRTDPALRQLGYPTKNALKSWHREYEQNSDFQVGYVRSRQKYSDEQARVAVQHYLDHDRCIASTMKALGYPGRATLIAWIDELHPDMHHRIVGRAANVQHPLELKHAAVIELCARKTSAQTIAQRLAVCRPTLYNWKHQLLGREVPLA